MHILDNNDDVNLNDDRSPLRLPTSTDTGNAVTRRAAGRGRSGPTDSMAYRSRKSHLYSKCRLLQSKMR